MECRATGDFGLADADALARSDRRGRRLAAAAVALALPSGFGLVVWRDALVDDLLFEAALAQPEGVRAERLLGYVGRGLAHDAEAASVLARSRGRDLRALRRHAGLRGPTQRFADDALFATAGEDEGALVDYLGIATPAHRAEADERLFAVARRRDAAAGYRRYLEVGRLHAAEVRDERLPEADLRDAIDAGQVAPLQAFVWRYPGPRHERARAEALAHVKRAYARAREAVTAGGSALDGALALRILDELERRGDPRIDVVVTCPEPAAVRAADRALAASHGDRALPVASWFEPGVLAPFRGEVRAVVAERFGLRFLAGTAAVELPAGGDPLRPRVEVEGRPVVVGALRWTEPDGDGREHAAVRVRTGRSCAW